MKQDRRDRSGKHRRWGTAVSLLAIGFGLPGTPALAENPQPSGCAGTAGADDRQIVVIGSRTIIAALKDVEVEKTYDADTVASYAFSTVGEVIDQLSQENGDSSPSLLVNGQRISGVNDIGDYPVEAIERVEVLPLGTASRIGGTPGQRAYNVVLKRQFRNLVLTGSRQMATEGGWANNRGEAQASLIKGQDRVNLSFRVTDSGMLLERDRDLVPLPQFVPYSALGNVLPVGRTELDSALSLLVGQPVSVLALSAFPARPKLTELIGGANRTNPSDLANYRGLRGASQNYDVSLAASKQLNSWLTAAINGRAGWSSNSSLSGLPSAQFLVPVSNPFSPFSAPVTVAVNDPARPLRSDSNNRSQGLTGTLNINAHNWRVTLVGKVDWRTRTYGYDQVVAGSNTVDNLTNPFGGNLGSLIALSRRSVTTRTVTRELSEDAEGPLLRLPAGSIRLRVGIGSVWSSLDADDTTGLNASRYRRHDLMVRSGLTIPLTGPAAPALAGLGTSELSFDFGRTDLGRFGHVSREAYVLSWQPVRGLRLSASRNKEGRPIAPELVAAPSQEYDNVRFYDPLRNEMAVVTTIYGGAGNLRNESSRIDRFSVSASPFARNLLQMSMDYTVNLTRNPIGALPAPSAAVVDAFPDRFVRNSSAQLIRVDGRTVNFDSQYSRELRTALDVTVPLFGTALLSQSKGPVRAAAKPTLQLHLAHTWLLENITTIRAGLGEVNLLDGGAIGLGGGRPRHMLDGSLALTDRGTGIRLSGQLFGNSRLRVGSVAAPDLLKFAAYAKLDLKLFADLGTLVSGSRLAKGARISLNAENLTNNRQRVANSLGEVPTSFQPAYRDPIGRTITVELRKSF